LDKRYADAVTLLVNILPYLDTELRFALKGGTAINLFEHDLPRLSIDIDLTWLPTQDFDTDTTQIAEALTALAARLSAPPLRLQVRESAALDAPRINRLIVSRGRTQVKIETSPVMRGAVHPVRRMDLRPDVERRFGSAQLQVLHFADLYGGKLAAALSRQHPRDLFDIGVLLEQDRLDTEVWRTFLIYLTASPKPAAEMLAPAEPRDFAAVFERQFRGMTREPVTVQWLLDARIRLLARMQELLDTSAREFLISVERESPDFGLIGLPQAAMLPGVRRKLQNLASRSRAKREADYRQLAETLERIAQAE
jgi:predicted nucleotidyltransferase component of viral defense system